MDRMMPGYKFNGKLYRTAKGLLTAVMKDCGAIQVGMVDKNGKMKAWRQRGAEPCAVYSVQTPLQAGIGNPMLVTRD